MDNNRIKKEYREIFPQPEFDVEPEPMIVPPPVIPEPPAPPSQSQMLTWKAVQGLERQGYINSSVNLFGQQATFKSDGIRYLMTIEALPKKAGE